MTGHMSAGSVLRERHDVGFEPLPVWLGTAATDTSQLLLYGG